MYSSKETIRVNIHDLKGHPKNPKKHNDEFIEKSIDDLGYAENVVIDENNTILSGHGRIKALRKRGETEVEVIKITGWTEEEKEKYLMMANQSVISGGYDDSKLNELSQEILDYVGLAKQETESKDEGAIEFTEELLEEHNYIVLYFNNSIGWNQALTVFGDLIKSVKALDSKKGFEKVGIGRVIDGKKALNKLFV